MIRKTLTILSLIGLLLSLGLWGVSYFGPIYFLSLRPVNPDNPVPHRPAAQRGAVGGELLGFPVAVARPHGLRGWV